MKRSPYEGFAPLRAAGYWEERTREVVLHRLHVVPPIRFFTQDEALTLTAVAGRLLPQPDRAPGERVPITPFIDQMLFEDDGDGFRKQDMPWEQQAWRWGLVGLDETSRAAFGVPFTRLSGEHQDEVLSQVQAGQAEGETWQRMPAAEFFGKLLQQVVAVYYAHPTAWAEIGWPGPASRRGYMRTGYGRLDPWQPRPTHEVSSVGLVRMSREGSAAGGTGGATH